MIYNIFIGILSILGLLFGAEIIINKTKRITSELKISDFFIGLTVFSIGTSLPEIATHVIASIDILRGTSTIETMSGLAVGVNIGSNIIQITLITGIVAFFGILKVKKEFLKIDYIVMLSSIAALFLFSLDNKISKLEGLILIISYVIYLAYLIKKEKLKKKIIKEVERKITHNHFYTDIIIMISGLIILLLSADKIAELTDLFTQRYLIPSSVLGTLIVGVATALPEFTTSMFAIRKKNVGISLGILVGSNITNPLLALGIGAVISSYTIEQSILWFDIPFWFIISVILLLMMWKKRTLSKTKASLLIVSYILFVFLRLYIF